MEQKPPRRAKRRSGGAPSFPIIPAVLAVLVAGFLIGTALSLFGNRIGSPVAFSSPPPFPTTAPEVSALPATPRPEPATAKPAATPSPRRTAKPVPTSTPAPTATPLPAASPLITATPAATGVPITSPLRPAAETSGKPAVAVKATPEPTLRPVAKPTAEPTVKPTVKPSTSSVAAGASSDYADSDFAQLSAGVVRNYLGALQRGDEDSAYAAFGAAPGDRGIIFTEQGILDAKTQIVRVDARQTGTDAATVEVVFKTTKGQYFAQYFLKRSPSGAALITDHEMIKP